MSWASYERFGLSAEGLSLANGPPMTLQRPGCRAWGGAPGRRRLYVHKDSTRGCPNRPRSTARKSCKIQRKRVRGLRSRAVRSAARLVTQRSRLDLAGRDRGVQLLDQQGRHQVELLRPHRRRAGDRHDPAALGSPASPRARSPRRRPRATRAARRRAASPARATPAAARARSRAGAGARRLMPPPPREDRRRRRPTAASRPACSPPGTCSRSVVVMTLWPRPRSSPTSRARRSRSSSLITSSSSITGVASRVAAIASRSASSSASRPSRCWPCEP